MEALCHARDFRFIFDSENNELENLPYNPLKAKLKTRDDGIDLGKTVFVELGIVDHRTGVSLEFFPKTQEGWKDVKSVEVTIDKYGIDQIKERGRYGIRYGFGGVAEFYNGYPIEPQ